RLHCRLPPPDSGSHFFLKSRLEASVPFWRQFTELPGRVGDSVHRAFMGRVASVHRAAASASVAAGHRAFTSGSVESRPHARWRYFPARSVAGRGRACEKGLSMMKVSRMVLVVALLCVAWGSALAGPNAGGALIFHTDDAIVYTPDANYVGMS